MLSHGHFIAMSNFLIFDAVFSTYIINLVEILSDSFEKNFFIVKKKKPEHENETERGFVAHIIDKVSLTTKVLDNTP